MKRKTPFRLYIGLGLLAGAATLPAVGCSGAGSAFDEGIEEEVGTAAVTQPGAETPERLHAIPERMADLPIEETADWLGERFPGRGITMAVSPIRGASTSEDVAAGSNHTLLLVRGTVWAWGNTTYGQIGTGGSGSAPQGSPVQVPGLPAIEAISAGGYHSLALDASGSVWAWGQNSYGQIGTGSASSMPQATPVQVPGLPPIKAISAGASHSMALDTSGVIWVWGASSYGQIGNGSSGINQVTPTSVSLPGGAAAISAGWHHSLAVSTDGSVWSWGRNNYGQIGNGTSGTTNRTTPYQVALGGMATAVAAGGGHSLALLSDKTVKAWGYNGQGQLGLGSTTSQPLPQIVPGLSNVQVIAAGGYFSMAMGLSGTVWSWGQDTQGQIGDGDASSTNRTTPYAMPSLNGARAIAAGAYHAAALSSACQVWTWGSNSNAQLGSGGADAVRHPTPASPYAWTRISYADSDMDGYGDPWSPMTESCAGPVTPGYVANDADCDDFDPSISPGASELCNGLDDDCSGVVDEGNPEGGDPCDTGHPGECGFGWLTCDGGALQCAQETPPMTETCDGLDNDCDMAVDEGACLAANGAACATAAQCQSGNCVDGYCCNTACGGTCQACNVSGSIGSCASYAANTDPANECAADCDGSGACEVINAGTITFPGENEFTFSGFPSNAFRVCATDTLDCDNAQGAPVGAGTRLISNAVEQLQNGVAVRGSIDTLDPYATMVYHVMELELYTGNFFVQNPEAHIAIAPRTLLPYVVPGTTTPYNGYAPFVMDGPSKRPHAYGNGIILGKVPCNNGLGGVTPAGYQNGNGDGTSDGHVFGVAIEHFLGAGDPENKTACPAASSQTTLDPYTVYSVKVFVKQAPCPAPSAAQCRSVGYAIRSMGAVFGPSLPSRGGGDTAFLDNSQPEPSGPVFGGGPTVVPRGWSRLLVADRSSWFIAHAFTNPGTDWSFQVRNLQLSVSNSAPAWWTSP
ncbi:MopE-related protein [Sorangium sp. So ce216]